MRFNNLLRFFILFCISVAGCTNTNNTPPVISFPTQTSIPITETPILPTETAIPTLTPTTVPTLSAEDAIKRLLDLLANNGGCHLPCLWGITPGKSTSEEAQAILSPLGSIKNSYSLPARFNSEKGSVHPIYAEGNLMLDIRASYLSDNQITNHLFFYAEEYQLAKTPSGELGLFGVFDSETLGKRVDYYSLSHVLSEQGIPEAVMIATSYTPPTSYLSIYYFYIVLLYPEQGIWVKYTTLMQINGAKLDGCPINAHVEMELFPSGNADSFSASLEQKQDWVIQRDWFQPLEKVTSMSLKQFYETFRHPTDKCIETPANLWP